MFFVIMAIGMMIWFVAHGDPAQVPYGYGNPDPLQRDYCHWVNLDFCYITAR